MADFLLSVGVDVGLSYDQMQKDISTLVSQLNSNPVRIKVGLDIDNATITKLREQITTLNGAFNTSGAGSMSGAVSGIAKEMQTASAAVSTANKNLKTTEARLNVVKASLAEIQRTNATINNEYAKLKNALGGENATGQNAADVALMKQKYIEYQAAVEQVRATKATATQEDITNIYRLQAEMQTLMATIRERIVLEAESAQAAEAAAAAAAMAAEAEAEAERRAAAESAKKAEQERREENERQQLLTRSLTLLQQMRNAEQNWTAAKTGRSSTAYAGIQSDIVALEELITKFRLGEISATDFKARLASLNAGFKTNADQIRANSEATKTWSERLGGLSAKFGTWFSITRVIMAAYRAIREMVSAVIELDTAMTELKKVTNETDATYEKFLVNATKRARQLGAELADTVSATADFARLGFGIADAEKLADAAIVYKNVGDGIDDIGTASESIIATMQAFSIPAEEVMKIVDKFNEVGNNYAISSKGVGDALLRSAAAMNAANNSLDETIALAAAANTIVQDPEKVGTTLKTVSMYLRAAKTEAEEAGESTEGMANSVSELRDEILRLTGNKVDIQIDENTFKSTYQILQELSQVWGELSDLSQANILEMVGGKRNSNVVAALLENFTVAENAMKTSAESAGSALAENEKVLESIQGKLNIMKAEFQTFAQNFIGSGLVKFVVDFATGILSVLNGVSNVIEALGGFKTVLMAVVSALLIAKGGLIAYKIQLIAVAAVKKIITFCAALKNGIVNIIQIIPNAITAWKAYAAGTVSASTAMQASIPVIGLVLAALTALTAGIAMCSSDADDAAEDTQAQIEETNQKMKALAETAADYSDELINLAMNYLSASEALETLSGSTDSYIKARDDLIKSLNIEQSELDKLIEKYGSYDKAVAQASLSKLRDQEIDLRGGLTAAEDAVEVTSQVVMVQTEGMEQNAKEVTEAYDALTKAYNDAANKAEAEELNVGINFGKGNVLDADDNVVEGYMITITDATDEAVEKYGHFLANKIQEYTSYKWLLGKLADNGVGAGNVVYDGLYARYNDVKESVEGYLDAVKALNENLAYQYMLEQTITDGLPTTQAEFDTFRQKIIDAAVASGEFSGDATDVADAIDNVLGSQSNFSAFYAIEDGKAKLSDLAEVVSKLKSNYDLLATAQKEMADGDGGLSASTIQALADETDRYLDYLYEENGVIKLNTEAWKAYANEKMLGDISAIEDEITLLQTEKSTLEGELATLQAKTTLTTEESERVKELNGLIAENTTAIETNQAKLGLYSSLYNNISGSLDAYSAALQNFSNISNAITSVSDSLTTVADLQETVANGFTISLEKALEFAKVYPEILNGATVAADGQIALNEGIVNAFIEGKEAELKAQIDAEVAKLEADKAVLTAKMEFSKAQLELAKSVGTGEGQISKEVAEYRVNAGNAVAQALIAAGIDEATAYQLACAAMAQNSEEFNRVAAEVCTDVQGNFNQAAYDAAQAIYTNMQNSKLSIASVAAQAHEAAKAIAGIASGTVQGSSSVNGGGASGSYTGKGNITVHSGSFKGTEYTYEAKTISLEDFISDLELDISNYQQAISQIDGQIATLKALRNTSLNKFSTSNKNAGKGSGSGGSNSKDNEPTWFEKEYALHQHLLKMDAENVEDYLDWLNSAYQRAYKEGIIDLDDYYKYQEEVYTGLQDLFKDYLNDTEHEISMRENYDGESDKIISMYEKLMKDVEKEIAAARAQGLDDTDDYIQELQKKWQGYYDSVTDIRESAEEDAKDAIDELVDYRIDMIKQEIEDEKDALDKKLDYLKEFYDKQKEMLQDQYDEEKYLEEQSEKRKTVTDLKSELAMLENDDSAWAQKRKLELQEELATAEDDLGDFEDEHALDMALDALDNAYNAQEAQIQAEMDALDERLNDPEALFNQALNDIKNNTGNLYQEMLEYNRKHGTGNDEDVTDKYEEAYKALLEYQDVYGEAYKGIVLPNSTNYKPENGSWDDSKISGTNPDNKPKEEPKKEEPKKEEPKNTAPSLSKGSTITVKKSATHFGSKSNGVRMASFVPGGSYTVYQTSGNQVLIGRNGVYTGWINKSDIVGYAKGTKNATAGLHSLDELGSEYLFTSTDGNKYRVLSSGDKVLNARATDFLYEFANGGGEILEKIIKSAFGTSLFDHIQPVVNHNEIDMGDVIVQGSATQQTVSEIRRAQRDNLTEMLKSLNKLNK